MTETAVRMDSLTIRRGKNTVFDGFDLTLPRGVITGLLGPSGSGKTTLIRAIVGVQQLESGTVTVLGRPAGTRELRSRVAYASQAASVYDDLTVEQNLRYFARLLGPATTTVPDAIARVGLEAQATQLVGSLSGGQRGRVSLAVALLGSPELLVLDEPTVGLDPVLRESLWAIFRSLADKGMTLLVSSHVMDEALRCDELVLLREGRMLLQAPPAQLLERTGAADPDTAFLRLIEGRPE